MQIGSGTWGLNTALTYTYLKNKWSFGAQGGVLLRTGTNDNEYRLGNKYQLTSWTGYAINNWLSLSGRFSLQFIDRIDGVNPVLNPNMVITADTNNSGASIAHSGIGFNVLLPHGFLKDLRLAGEFSIPMFQNLNGIQLKQQEQFTIGLQYGF